jgi:accessory Sec system protein Asp3
MMNNYFVAWPPEYADVWINGSTIRTLSDNRTYYANEMISPGQIIAKWRSQTNYLETGVQPTLPLLKRDHQYFFDAVIKANREPAVQWQIVFFDVGGNMIDEMTFQSNKGTFLFPKDATTYEVNLINLYHKWLEFTYFEISDVDQSSQIFTRVGDHGLK